MKRVFTSLLLVAAGLVACQTAPTPVIEKPEYQLLGKLELAFGETPIGTARAKFTPVGLRGQAVVNESQLTFTANTFSTAVRTADNNRFLNAQFWIRNNTGTLLQNLVLVAAHRSGNDGGSALKNINNFNGVNLANYARATKPSHAMGGNGTVSVVADKEHLALFSEYDVDRMTVDAGAALGSNEYLLPYGFLVSKLGATGDPDNYYNIPPNTVANTGEVTVSMRVDGSNEPPSSNAYRFTFTAMVFGQATLPLDKSPIAESLEEISTTTAQTRASARNAAPGTSANQTYYLNGSSSLNIGNLRQNNVCQVRMAGTVEAPTTLGGTIPSSTIGDLYDCFGASGKRTMTGTGFTDIAKFSDGRLAMTGMNVNGQNTPLNTYGIFKPNAAIANKAGFFQNGTAEYVSRGITVDSQGRMIWIADGTNDVYVQRRSASVTNSMDTQAGDLTFGTSNGALLFAVGGTSNNTYAYDVATQINDKIIVAGATENGSTRQIFLRRLNATDGSVDSTFLFAGGNLPATASTSFSQIYSMVIDSADKIIVTGSTRETSSDDLNMFVARFNADGTADTTFDSDGFKIEALSSTTEDLGQTVVLDGTKILVAGHVLQSGYKALALTRFTNTGALDNTFGTNGKLILAESITDIEARKVLLQPNGRIVVVSYAYFHANANTNNDRTVRVERFLTNGARDTTFNASGTIPGQNQYDVSAVRETPESAVIVGTNTNAKLVVVGQTNQNGSVFSSFAISINLGDIVSTGSSSN